MYRSTSLRERPSLWLGQTVRVRPHLSRRLSVFCAQPAASCCLTGMMSGRSRPIGGRSSIGYAPEGRRIFPGLSVRENLEVASFEGAGETGVWLIRCMRFSRGLRKREEPSAGRCPVANNEMLAVSRALIEHKPRLLLLDEPSLGLSPKRRTRCWAGSRRSQEPEPP